jgi:hypothetical protein
MEERHMYPVATSVTSVLARGASALLIAGLLTGCGTAAAGQPDQVDSDGPVVRPPEPTASASPPGEESAPSPDVEPPTPVSYPADGDNRWDIADAELAPAPGPGQLLRYQVAVERDIGGVPVAGFAAEVTSTLTDPQGWTAGGVWRLLRVGPNQRADFTVYLATPGTRDLLCQDVPDGYTSCRNGDRVVLNVARWVKGAPAFGSDIAGYRQYLVNHEVGHRLGMGHELCPGPGQPAPVMQQQTLGLHGCTPNGLPYLDGRRHHGPSGAYEVQIPPRDPGMPG